MTRIHVASLVAVASMLMPASAQETWRAEADRLVRGVVLQDLVAIVAARGDAIDSERIVSGDAQDVSVLAVTSDGLYYQLIGRACTEEAFCRGIIIQVRYNFEGTPNYAFLNQANYARAAVSVWHTPGTIGVSRYLILDNGQTIGNVETNLEATLAMAPFVAEVAENGLPAPVEE